MKLYIYLTMILLILSAASCDRFEHTFNPAETTDIQTELFTPLQTAFDTITSSDVSAVMDLYAEDYLHNNQQKADREAFYYNLLQQNSNLNFTVQLISDPEIDITDTLATLTWRLIATDSAKAIVADSTFLGEQIIKRNNTWLLFGNRDACCPPVTYKQRVFIETFTYRTCPNCPIVEGLLHQLQLDNPFNLSYLEYHVSDEMDIGNLDVYGYYGYPSMPSVIFQGETKIIGSNSDNEQIFNQLVTQLAAQDAKINLTNLDYNLNNQSLSGTVRLNVIDNELDTSALKLKYVVIDKESALFNNSQGDPCLNVVIAKGTKSLSGVDLSQSVAFNLPLDNLPLAYAGYLPVDSYLVIWVQVTPDPFNNNATIFNALESYIPVNKLNQTRK